ncbi:MAG TPA: ABC transporter permease subunit [Bacillota bacterium]
MNIRIKQIFLIGRKGFHTAFYSFGLYFVIVIGYILAGLAVNTYIQTITEEGLLINSKPVSLPLYLAVMVGAIYLAIAASVSISRERESGTLEVLFYGPVDVVSYVSGKFLEQLWLSGFMLLFYILAMLIFCFLTNIGSLLDVLISAVFFWGLTFSIISFGILISSITKKIRVSILWLVGLFILFLAISWGDSLTSGLDPQVIPEIFLYPMSMLSILAKITNWISPFAYMDRGMQALSVWNVVSCITSLLYSWFYSLVLLGLAIFSLQRKGVRG